MAISKMSFTPFTCQQPVAITDFHVEVPSKARLLRPTLQEHDQQLA